MRAAWHLLVSRAVVIREKLLLLNYFSAYLYVHSSFLDVSHCSLEPMVGAVYVAAVVLVLYPAVGKGT